MKGEIMADEKIPFKLEYVKKRIFSALGQYENENEIVCKGSRRAEIERGISDAIYSALVEIYEKLFGKSADVPFIDGKTEGDFEISLDRVSLEALVCLASSKLCTEREASLYTRLLLKYGDLCESFFVVNSNQKSRNTFYSEKKRGIR